MRTSEEWRADYLRLSELFEKFKNSDMTMAVFLEQVEEIFKEGRQNSICYENLSVYRSGLKKFGLSTHAIQKTVRHEGIHARIAKKIIQDMGIATQPEVVYILDPILFRGVFGDAEGIGPAVEFPNLISLICHSKIKYIEFVDRMLNEHPSPSEVDRLLAK